VLGWCFYRRTDCVTGAASEERAHVASLFQFAYVDRYEPESTPLNL
jgi:hypothetical protein